MDSKRLKQIFVRQTTSFLAYLIMMVKPLRYGLNQLERDDYVVVSMTTYRPRMGVAYTALKSLLFQSYKPDKIVLYIEAKDKAFLGKRLNKLKKYGITIEVRDDIGIRSHKKYYYSLKEYPNALVITVDDDMIYRKDLLELLIKKHREYPDAVCAKRTHRIQISSLGTLSPYREWEKECRDIIVPSYELCATTGAGTLYPPSILPAEAFDVELIRKLAPYCDDIWLKFIETANNIKVVRTDGNYDLSYIIQFAQHSGLRVNNVENEGNDKCIAALDDYFKIEWKEIINCE